MRLLNSVLIEGKVSSEPSANGDIMFEHERKGTIIMVTVHIPEKYRATCRVGMNIRVVGALVADGIDAEHIEVRK